MRPGIIPPSTSKAERAERGFPLIILASGSPRRHELLSNLGLRFDICIPDVDETDSDAATQPADLVLRLSLRKARAAARRGSDDLVISADTIVSIDGDVLGKPRDPEHAVKMLARLRNRSHLVFSGLTLLDARRQRIVSEVARTPVSMRAYSDEEIAAYVASGDPMDKAGAYAIQHESFNPVERIEGCYANVMGLPLCHVYRALIALGVTPPAHPLDGCPYAVAHGCRWATGILGGRSLVSEA
jgi:MAF protein